MSVKIITLLILIPFSFIVSANDFYPEKLAIKSVKSILKNKNISLIEKVEVLENSKKESLTIYRFVNHENNKKFFALFTQAEGRYDRFDYLIIINSDLVIQKVDVLKYRSQHGGEIASKKWLRQFENYSSGELRYKKEISALSGATISANSIVDDVPKVLKILKLSCNSN